MGTDEAYKLTFIDMNTHTHMLSHTHSACTQQNQITFTSFPEPPSNINRDCSEGCATVKIYVRVTRCHKSLGKYTAGVPVSVCVCEMYSLAFSVQE